MCCPTCEKYGVCHTAVTLRIHKQPVSGMPPNHYVLCRNTKPCDDRCGACDSVVRRFGAPPKTIYSYGCCSQCSQYRTCDDFVERHVRQARLSAAAADKSFLLWEQTAARSLRVDRGAATHR